MSFLRYVEGSIPSKKFKRRASADERQVAKKKYDKESRERKFLHQWTKDRSWLAYEKYKQLMFCNWCRNHEVDSVFVKGTNKFKLDAIKQHESSKPHQYYQSRYNRTSQTQLNLFISVIDLNLGIFFLNMGDL
jgi:hypothetical protein